MSEADELETLRAFRSAMLHAFVAGDVSCNCMGVTHNDGCPLGQLEVEAEQIRMEGED